MCLGVIPAKTLCRIFAFCNVFLGLLSLYYWELLSSFIDKIAYAPSWDSVLLNQESIEEQCGIDYFKTISTHEFGIAFKQAIYLYITACIIYSIKGFIQFFVTCFDPVLARSLGITIFVVDLATTCIFFYGLNLFRSPKLCLLEHSDIVSTPGLQSQMTWLNLIVIMIIKPTELISLICFLREQSLLISFGETRSKGARRSDAFCTPMISRTSLAGGYHGPSKDNRKGQPYLLQGLLSQQPQSNSEDDDEESDDHQEELHKYLTIYDQNQNSKEKFMEVDLNENEMDVIISSKNNLYSHSQKQYLGQSDTDKDSQQFDSINGNDV